MFSSISVFMFRPYLHSGLRLVLDVYLALIFDVRYLFDFMKRFNQKLQYFLAEFEHGASRRDLIVIKAKSRKWTVGYTCSNVSTAHPYCIFQMIEFFIRHACFRLPLISFSILNKRLHDSSDYCFFRNVFPWDGWLFVSIN